MHTSLPWRVKTYANFSAHTGACADGDSAAGQEWLTGMKGSCTTSRFTGASNSLTILPIVVFNPVLYGSVQSCENYKIIYHLRVCYYFVYYFPKP